MTDFFPSQTHSFVWTAVLLAILAPSTSSAQEAEPTATEPDQTAKAAPEAAAVGKPKSPSPTEPTLESAKKSAPVVAEKQAATNANRPELDTHKPSSGETVQTEEVNEDKVPQSEQEKNLIWNYFSAGFIVNIFPKSDRVSEAEIREGVVRAKAEDDAVVSLGLQASFPVVHRSVYRRRKQTNGSRAEYEKVFEWGVGPYVGVSSSTTEVIDALGIGLQYSAKRYFGGVVLGCGFTIDPDAKFLADDFVDGEAVGEGVQSVQFKKKPAYGFQMMISFTPGW